MLEGISDVLKYFRASRLASAALLTTTVCLSFGPRYASAIPRVPPEWQWLLWAIMILTAFQCAYWALEALVRILSQAARSMRNSIFPLKLRHLSNAEHFVLVVAADNGGHFFDERAEQYNPRPEVIAISLAQESLARRGLMEMSFAGSYLTESGKNFCLENELSKRVSRRPEMPREF